MLNVEIALPSEQELIAQVSTGLSTVDQYPVTTVAEYQTAGTELKMITARERELEAKRVELKKPILEAGRGIDKFFGAPLALLQRLKDARKRGMLAYDAEQERKRSEEEERLRAIARKEQERLAAEARKVEEASRRKQELLRAQAEAAHAAGEHEKASRLETRIEAALDKAAERCERLESEAASIPVPILAREQPKAAGVRRVQVWHARVVDAALVPREYLIINESALDKVAKATKGAIRIPGVEIYCTVTVAG
jgi:chromosome segregation ATPase